MTAKRLHPAALLYFCYSSVKANVGLLLAFLALFLNFNDQLAHWTL